MDEKKPKNKTFFDSRFYICFFIVAFISIQLFMTILYKNSAGFDETEMPFGEDWTYQDGHEANLEEIRGGKTVTISKRIRTDELGDDALCFDTKNIYFTIYLDNDLIYDFRPSPPKLFGKSYGTFYHTVMIPNIRKDAKITFVVDSLYENTSGYIRNMKLCNANTYLLEKMQNAAPTFLLCLGVFAFGIVFFIIGVVGRYYGDSRYEIIGMGTLAIVSSIWMATESPLFALITNAPISVHFLNYLSLMFLPVPTVLFASYITGNKKSGLPVIIGFISMLNFVFTVSVNLFGKKDYHQLLWISHVILAITIVCLIYFLIRGIVEKKIRKWLIALLIVTNAGPVAIGVVEMIRYRLAPGGYTMTSFYKYSIFVFIITYGVYECINLSEMSRRSQYADIMERIAYTDDMTGLLNRSSFNKETGEAKKGNDTYTIIVMDMNHLKLVNDKMGHAMGDEYIITIGKIIREAFEKKGKCFRIGGDEFFAMTLLEPKDAQFHEIIGQINSEIEKYNLEHKDVNHLYPLSIATGYVRYNPQKISFEEAFHMADENMYEQKKKMRMEVGKV